MNKKRKANEKKKHTDEQGFEPRAKNDSVPFFRRGGSESRSMSVGFFSPK